MHANRHAVLPLFQSLSGPLQHQRSLSAVAWHGRQERSKSCSIELFTWSLGQPTGGRSSRSGEAARHSRRNRYVILSHWLTAVVFPNPDLFLANSARMSASHSASQALWTHASDMPPTLGLRGPSLLSQANSLCSAASDTVRYNCAPIRMSWERERASPLTDIRPTRQVLT